MINNISYLDYLTDIIIIDTGAGISDSVLDFVIASPEVLLVVTPDPSSLTDSYSLVKALYNNPKFDQNQTRLKVVANRVRSSQDGQNTYSKLSTVVENFLAGNLEYLGMIPYDSAIDNAIRQQKPISLINENAISSKAFDVLANNLVNGANEQYIMRRGFKDMFYNLFNRA